MVTIAIAEAQARRLRVLPDLIEALPKIAREVAAPTADIKNLTVLSNGGADGNDALNKVAGSVPALLLRMLETAKAGGLELGQLLGGNTGPLEPRHSVKPAVEPVDRTAGPSWSSEVTTGWGPVRPRTGAPTSSGVDRSDQRAHRPPSIRLLISRMPGQQSEPAGPPL